jgi:hypothetical protein
MYLYDCYFILIMQGQQSLWVFQHSVKNIWMQVEFQRSNIGDCTFLIQQVVTKARPGKFPNHHWSANYIKTTDTGVCEVVLVLYTNLTQWQKTVSARSTMKSDKERV